MDPAACVGVIRADEVERLSSAAEGLVEATNDRRDEEPEGAGLVLVGLVAVVPV
jgi:hypothetical protein